MRLAVLILLAVALCACASTPGVSPGYAAYLEFVAQQQSRDDARIAGIAAAAQSCTDARCVEHVATVAALASASGGQRAGAAPPPREPTGVETFAQIVGALSPVAATLVTGAVQWHQADASRDVSIAQYGALDRVLTGAVTGMRDVSVGAVPSITVGGDYVPGAQTHVGRDYITGNPLTIGGDAIGRDQYRGPVAGGDQRWSSPGPVGNGCQGDGCQPQPAPVP